MSELQSDKYSLRTASETDVPTLSRLIRESAHALSRGDYSTDQVEAALVGTFGVDSQLIRDQTYFVIEAEGKPVACGGWSFRATLFGNDSISGRNADTLDPNTDAARIRAFFVHPEHARRGLGKWILNHCESAARSAGFTRLELGATLPGLRLYEACGYVAGVQQDHIMENGMPLPVVPMWKTLSE